jgi:hypothetical protein
MRVPIVLCTDNMLFWSPPRTNAHSVHCAASSVAADLFTAETTCPTESQSRLHQSRISPHGSPSHFPIPIPCIKSSYVTYASLCRWTWVTYQQSNEESMVPRAFPSRYQIPQLGFRGFGPWPRCRRVQSRHRGLFTTGFTGTIYRERKESEEDSGTARPLMSTYLRRTLVLSSTLDAALHHLFDTAQLAPISKHCVV